MGTADCEVTAQHQNRGDMRDMRERSDFRKLTEFDVVGVQIVFLIFLIRFYRF